ncbi:MAG TPA: hypothetical protein VMR50_05775 [Myxococcota bacterium]|nr:hypothetical protein [Myxococcota bacterium]
MSSVQPRLNVSGRALAARLALLALALVLGLGGALWMRHYLAQIQEYAKTDLLGARAWLARSIQMGSLFVFGSSAAVGVGVILSARRRPNLRWVGFVLGGVLVAASAAGAGLSWYMAAVLKACRAGLPH